MGTTKLIKASLKATRKNAYKQLSRLEAWMDGVKEDREEDLQVWAALHARIELCNQLLDLIKAQKNKEVN